MGKRETERRLKRKRERKREIESERKREGRLREEGRESRERGGTHVHWFYLSVWLCGD